MRCPAGPSHGSPLTMRTVLGQVRPGPLPVVKGVFVVRCSTLAHQQMVRHAGHGVRDGRRRGALRGCSAPAAPASDLKDSEGRRGPASFAGPTSNPALGCHEICAVIPLASRRDLEHRAERALQGYNTPASQGVLTADWAAKGSKTTGITEVLTRRW